MKTILSAFLGAAIALSIPVIASGAEAGAKKDTKGTKEEKKPEAKKTQKTDTATAKEGDPAWKMRSH
jgi:hypothetical protein